ncbi:beta-lactamase [Aspergillus sclerotialis]|uniref:Beta-lactamase n=1 Tax=Aspergillus sclerotialis TaxID=2070753 RepID=A0A3A2Z8L9_9EURO|nr:beta-lactamase [Aspergillus sclerotialis]
MSNAFMEMMKAAAAGTQGRGEQQLPSVVRIAADSSGEIKHVSANGTTALDPSSPPMTPDSIFHLASCTKLVTSIAVLQCVEKGLLSLDDDISTILPEWSNREILTGFNEETGEPMLQKSEEKLTLKHLLTHSSGMAYDIIIPALMQWWKWKGEDSNQYEGIIAKAYQQPLVFAPGSSWCYGPGIDWAGVMVCRVTNSSLSAYMQTNIFSPLDITSAAFRASDLPKESQGSGLVTMACRTPSGELVPCPPVRNPNPQDDLGGGGLYMSATDYIKILISLLRDDGKLLQPSTLAELFNPHLSPEAKETLTGVLSPSFPPGTMMRSGVDGKEWNHSLGGLLNMEDVDGMCKCGTLSWSGIQHLFWWVDPQAGICGLYASQLMPPNDETTLKDAVEFRKDMYQKFGKK